MESQPEPAQPAVVPSREGYVLLEGKRVYARLFSNALVVSDTPSASSRSLPLSTVFVGETEGETKAWNEAVDKAARFQEDRNALLLEAVPSHVRASLLPEEDKPADGGAAAAAAGSVRLHLRSLTGKNNTVTVARSGRVRDLKGLAAEGAPLDKVNLIFKAAILADEAPLDLPDDSVVFVVVKQHLQPRGPVAAPAPAAPAALLDEELPAKLLALAAQMYSLGDYHGSSRAAEKAFQVLEGRKTPQVVTCLNAMALVEKKMAHYARAMELYEQAMQLALTHDDNLRVIAELNLNTADVNRKLEKYDAAMKLYETAHNMAKKLDNNNKKLLVGILVGKGLIEKKNSHFDAAIALYQEALKLESKGTAKWAEIAYNYADVLRKQEKLTDAKKLYEEALVVTEATLGARHAEVAEICNALGMLEKKNGDYANARLHYERGSDCAIVVFFFV
jgi:tetratricopeptide (TPR) repeat protein